MNWAYSCKRVAELLSQRIDERLGLVEELKLRIHLSMCSNCSNVAEQLEALEAASAQLFADDPLPSEPDQAPGGTLTR